MRNSIGKSTLLITASKLMGLAINMACVMLLSRIRTLDEYGTYSQLLMASSLFSTLLIMGLPNSINFFLSKEDSQAGRRSFLSHYYTLNLLLCGVAGGLLVICIPLLEAYFHNDSIGKYAFFLLLYPFASITMSSVESVFVIYERPRSLVVYRLLNSVSLLTVILIADWCGLSFFQYLLLFTATEAAFAIAVYVLAWRLCGALRPAFSAKKLKEIAAFCIPIGLAAAVSTLSRELDKLVISHYFSTEEYAIYTNAAKELPLTVLASSTTMVIMPKIVQLLHKGENDKAISLWKDAFIFNFAVMAVMVAGVAVFAPEAITILYSEKYLPGITVFRIYALLLLLRSTYFGMILNALGETKYIFRISVLQLAANVILNLLGCKYLGFAGPALATVAVDLMGAALFCRRTGRELKTPFFSVVPWKGLLAVAAVNIVFSAAFIVIKRLFHLEVWVGGLLANVLEKRILSTSVGECTESIILGVIWVLLYAAVMYRPIKRLWTQMNRQGET